MVRFELAGHYNTERWIEY